MAETPAIFELPEDLREKVNRELSEDTKVHTESPNAPAKSPKAEMSGETREWIAGFAAEAYPRLLRYARVRMGARETVVTPEDVVQDCFLGLMRTYANRIPQTDDKGPMPLMYGIMAKTLVNAYRKQARRRDEPVEDFKGNEPLTRWLDDEVVDAMHVKETVEAAFHGLGPRQRFILEIVLADPDISAEELAVAAKIKSKGAARVAKHRALAMARQIAASSQSLKGIVEGAEDQQLFTEKSKPVYKGPATTPAKQQVQLVDALSASRTRGENQAIVRVPLFVGPWSVVARDAAAFMAEQGNSEPKLGIVYPHEHLLDEFKEFMFQASDGKLADASLHITSPEEIAHMNDAHLFDYLAVPETLPIDTLPLIKAGGFAVRVCFLSSESPPPGLKVYSTLSYKEIGAKKIQWTDADSIRYAEEYRMLTGKTLGVQAITKLSTEGHGPSKTRLGTLS